ncbi:MAG: hypothetical protein ONB46_14870 [candidate division KSB1 bacterium]|nr:hypothetical protein [candidate division KSB1 bacterium]MDZ7367027.1 hypothetical protein [candidate division KSB1 bacterium]MDZ7406727.1 hypothetical protein [candidate division KSB1 bacterium]
MNEIYHFFYGDQTRKYLTLLGAFVTAHILCLPFFDKLQDEWYITLVLGITVLLIFPLAVLYMKLNTEGHISSPLEKISKSRQSLNEISLKTPSYPIFVVLLAINILLGVFFLLAFPNIQFASLVSYRAVAIYLTIFIAALVLLSIVLSLVAALIGHYYKITIKMGHREITLEKRARHENSSNDQEKILTSGTKSSAT